MVIISRSLSLSVSLSLSLFSLSLSLFLSLSLSFSLSLSLSLCRHVTCNNGPTRITKGLNLVDLILTRFGDLWGNGNVRLRSRLGATEELAAEPHCLLACAMYTWL